MKGGEARACFYFVEDFNQTPVIQFRATVDDHDHELAAFISCIGDQKDKSEDTFQIHWSKKCT